MSSSSNVNNLYFNPNNQSSEQSGRTSPSLSEYNADVPASSLAVHLSDNPYDERSSVTGSVASKKSSASATAVTGAIPFLHPYAGSSSSANYSSATRLPNPPSLVAYKQMRFLIMDAPSETNLQLYIKEMEKYNVTDVVRVCDPSYPKDVVERHGIKMHELIFPDGEAPPENVVSYWLGLVESRFGHEKSELAETEEHPGVTIAIHCVAGLGRAPVLVAIALIESGMTPFDAISYIRERRRGAINTRQLKYLEQYRRRGKSSSPKCAIM